MPLITRLNPAHSLCSPSRKLLFATFGTGYGAQVLDLADQPSHGTMQGNVSHKVVRTLTSGNRGGFPSDYQSLLGVNFTGSSDYIDYGRPDKLASLTGPLTVAAWVRPFQTATRSTCLLSLGLAQNPGGGWNLSIPSTFVSGGGTSWKVINSTGGATTWQGTRSADRHQWNLVVATQVAGAALPTLYLNGADDPLADSGWTQIALTAPPAVATLKTGVVSVDGGSSYDYWDSYVGPAFIWGSVLSAADVALLYRDTFGMVQTQPPIALRTMGMPAPVVTSNSASGQVGTAFSYQITATNTPTSYGASGLPTGLSVNTGTGAITGTPTQSGSFSVSLSATNAGGTGTGTLTLVIAPAPSTSMLQPMMAMHSQHNTFAHQF